VHCIVPGGGISPAGDRWVRCRPNFFLSVRVLSRLFRRLFLSRLAELHAAGELQLFGDLAELADTARFHDYLAPLLAVEWVVYAKRPFAGPQQVLAYLARYTHRVAISNHRLVAIDDTHVSFCWKDYRDNGRSKSKVMRVAPGEFMRRFLLHVLPDGFHRIRHYGLFANGHRADKLALCRKLLDVSSLVEGRVDHTDQSCVDDGNEPQPCPCCGGRMKVIETFERGEAPRAHVTAPRYDSS
jgi:hypothetical protein